MCVSCGCKQPNESHGDSRNITMNDIRAAEETNGTSTGETVRNIQECFRTAENTGAEMNQ